MKKDRIVYIDMLRIVAIWGVIIIHVSAVGVADYAIGSKIWMISKLYDGLFRWSVPIFFMISGACFLGTDKVLDYNIIFKKYILKLLLCIFVWGMFYSLFDQYLYGSISFKSIIVALYGILTNHTGYHLWYLYYLVMLYLCIPIFKIIISYISKKQLELLLCMWFFLSLGITQVNELISDLGIGLSGIDYSFPVITGYAGYFLLGYYMYTYGFSKTKEIIIITVGVISIVAATILDVYSSVLLNCSVNGLANSCGVFSCLGSLAIWFFVKKIHFSEYEKISSIIIKIASNVMGVYLIHVFLNSMIFRVWKMPFSFSPLGILLVSVMIFISSFFISFFIKKIPVIKNIV